MIKVMLKGPVGGMIREGQAVRTANYLLVEGTLDGFIKQTTVDSNVRWLSGVSPAGEAVVVPIDNIAFLIEVKESGN